ncbi:hypothetical protein FB451DRAFT_1551080 [Mycena latifolia]|nr:hypothetical protein FB451DRAFT_1551080 [Mycena latifolia]
MKGWSTTGLKVTFEVETSMKFTLYAALLGLAALACSAPLGCPVRRGDTGENIDVPNADLTGVKFCPAF